jgi:hypothetical protein
MSEAGGRRTCHPSSRLNAAGGGVRKRRSELISSKTIKRGTMKLQCAMRYNVCEDEHERRWRVDVARVSDAKQVRLTMTGLHSSFSVDAATDAN